MVIAIIAILAAMLLPALSKAKLKAQGIASLNNKKQLTLAWAMYTGDFNDALPINSDQSFAYKNTPSWVGGGFMDWGTTAVNNSTAYLINDLVSSMGPYTARSPKIYWCPADMFVSPLQRQQGWANRVRSVAMNAAMGDGVKYAAMSQNGFGWGGFFWATKMSQLTTPGPSQSWLLMDEHPDSIDDGIFYTNPAATNGVGSLTEMPASLHGGASAVSFADGHTEMHKWQESVITVQPVRYVTYLHKVNANPPAFNRDLAWIAERTPIGTYKVNQ